MPHSRDENVLRERLFALLLPHICAHRMTHFSLVRPLNGMRRFALCFKGLCFPAQKENIEKKIPLLFAGACLLSERAQQLNKTPKDNTRPFNLGKEL